MGKATYNNSENLGADFVKYTLGQHLNRIEQELNIKLFRLPRFFTEFNVAGLQRGDSAARAAYFKAALGGTQSPGWMTPDEVRKTENLPPIAGGNKLYKPEPAAPAPDPEPEPAPKPAPTEEESA
jgi:phage portal protein BeeE